MAGILSLILVFGLLVGFNILLRILKHAGHATVRTVTNGGSFRENLNLSVNGMGAFRMQVVDAPLNDEVSSPIVKAVEVMGRFPIEQSKNAAFVISVLDVTNPEAEAVLSCIDNFQEKSNLTFMHRTEIGELQPGFGFTRWIRAGVVPTEILQTPRSGRRKLMIILRLVNVNQEPAIEYGFHTKDDSGILWSSAHTFEIDIRDKGYVEAADDRRESLATALGIGMAVACLDGPLTDEEGAVFNRWISNVVDSSKPNLKNQTKNVLNEALEKTFAQSQSNQLVLSSLTARLAEISEKKLRYETVQLCFDLVSISNASRSSLLAAVEGVSSALQVNLDELRGIRDRAMVKMDLSATKGEDLDQILGIQPDWNEEQVGKHLRSEFQKWNNRLNSLSEGPERENAQQILELIAQARKKSA